MCREYVVTKNLNLSAQIGSTVTGRWIPGPASAQFRRAHPRDAPSSWPSGRDIAIDPEVGSLSLEPSRLCVAVSPPLPDPGVRARAPSAEATAGTRHAATAQTSARCPGLTPWRLERRARG